MIWPPISCQMKLSTHQSQFDTVMDEKIKRGSNARRRKRHALLNEVNRQSDLGILLTPASKS
jgi:hypothetical protein